ncbi:hypothetical protein MKW94_013671, partial [Papaver nudicaule]|nr:hypothetical protein [Papaver nudicaule]
AIPGGTSNRTTMIHTDRHQGGNTASFPPQITEHIGSSNAARPGVHMQFKSSAGKNLGVANSTENAARSGFTENTDIPSTSFSLATGTKRNGMGNIIDPSSSWRPSLQHNSSGK